MAGLRTRRNVWKLAPWDDTLVWYAKAVAAMQARPITDPTSWRYQAAIHGFDPTNPTLTNPGEALPSQAEQDQFWTQCQHSSWYFLPWHRIYLHYFEQIVASTIVQLGGPDGWALPYWNYSDSQIADADKLPTAFRDRLLPDGTPNPLRVDNRNPGCNDGLDVGRPEDIDTSGALGEGQFTADPLGDPGFGGPSTGFNHIGGIFGHLERVPHGTMHVQVGGLMSLFETAALDPIFWLHHANIDRLWVVWNLGTTTPSTNLDPPDAGWLNFVFPFHDASGNEVSLAPRDVVDPTAALLGYAYEDVVAPVGPSQPSFRSVAPTGGPAMPSKEEAPIPEMVGATDAALPLTGQRATTSLAVAAPSGPAARTVTAGRPPRVFLNVENITGTGQPGVYDVYLNLPPGADPAQHSERFAGVLPMFGVVEASRADARHAGSGLHYTLEVTALVRRLQAAGDWDPANLRITFVPDKEVPASATPAHSIRIGRVSLYHA
jgi:tyrosinase